MNKRSFAIVLLLGFLFSAVLILLPRNEPVEVVKTVRTPAPTPAATPKFIGPVLRTKAAVTVLRQEPERYLLVDISDQRLYEMRDGRLKAKPTKVSTGTYGHSTPTGTFRIGWRIGGWHESTLYPGGMMYKPMYINGAIAIHGTPASNYWRLGERASHGCIRVSQEKADYLYDKYPNGTKVIVQS